MAAKVAPQRRRLRNAVLFEREDVRVMDNGVVLTKNLIEIEQIKRMPGRFRTSLNFPREMTSDEVRSELEKYFPQVKNRRYITIKDDLCLHQCSPWQEYVEKFF